MLKFRALKDKIICSKRHSQKLSEQELLSFTEQHSLSRLNLSLSSKLHAQIHQITHDHYKIPHSLKETNKNSAEKGRVKYMKRKQNMRTECVQAEEQVSHGLDFMLTAKKGMTKSVIEGHNFENIVDLLREVIQLRKLRTEFPQQSSNLGEQIKKKLAIVKVMLRSLEDDSQKSLIDFYNEDEQHGNSPDSFHSQSSDETYQPQTDREAYELSQRKDTNSTQEQEEAIEIKYRRLSPSDFKEESIFEMFYEDEREERDTNQKEEHSPQCANFQEKSSERAIVHLFSYEKENSLNTPLSRITEREEEYFSPQSKQSSLEASLQYKKIFYLLETSGKKEQQTYRREVSEFTPKSRSNSSGFNHNESKDRNRCHEQLGEMISLLQNKYHRKVKIGVENLMDSLNLAIKDKSIKLRKR